MSRYNRIQSDSSVFSAGSATAHFLDFNLGYNFTAMWDVDFSHVVEDLNCLLSEEDVDQFMLRLLLPIRRIGVTHAVAQHQKRLNSSGHQFSVLHAALNFWKVNTGGACHGLDVFEAIDDYRPGLAVQCRDALGLEPTSSQNLKYLSQAISPAGPGSSSSRARPAAASTSQRSSDWPPAGPPRQHPHPPPPQQHAASGVTSFPASSVDVLQCLETACQRVAGLEAACGRDDTAWLQYHCLWDAGDVGHQQLAAVLRHLVTSSQSLLHRMDANRELQAARDAEQRRATNAAAAAALDAQSHAAASRDRHHRQLHHGIGETPPPYAPPQGQSMARSFRGVTPASMMMSSPSPPSASSLSGSMSYASVTAAAGPSGRVPPSPCPEQGQVFAAEAAASVAAAGQWQQQGADNAGYASEVLPRMAGVSLDDSLGQGSPRGQHLYGPVLVRNQAVVPQSMDDGNQRRKEAVRGHGVDFARMNSVQVKHVGQQLERILSREEQLELTVILMHQLGTSANGFEEIESLRNSSDARYRNLSFVVALITRWMSMVGDTLATGKTVYEALQEISDLTAQACSAVLQYPQPSN